MLDGTVGKNDAVIRCIVGFLGCTSFKEFPNALTVLRMNPVEVKFQIGTIFIRLDAINAIAFWRACDFPG